MNAAVRRRHRRSVRMDDFDLTGPAPTAGQGGLEVRLELIVFPVSSKEAPYG